MQRNGLQDKFGEVLVPTEEVVEMRDGQRRKSERKFFPGYVLVQMEMDDETWHLVKEVPKVLGFIGGSSDRPAPITDDEAQAILNRVQEGVDKPRPKVLFEPGEVVRVTDGPFNDFSGVVEQVNYEKSKVRVAVQILGRSTPVELDFSQVEKAIGRTAPGLRALMAARDRRQRKASYGTKVETYIKLQVPAGKANPSPPVGPGARPARRQHHGVLQGVQRADAGHGSRASRCPS